MRQLTNNTNHNLYCVYSKERIKIGEQYIVVTEQLYYEEIEKTYKLEYKDFIDEE